MAMKKKTTRKNAAQKIKVLILGFFIVFIALEIALRFGGLIFIKMQDYQNLASLGDKTVNYRIMCLGDSTTALGGKNSYPLQLENILNQRSQRTHFSVINKGAILVDTSYILQHLEENIARYKPDMVTIMAGINDQYSPYTGEMPQNQSLFDKLKTIKFVKLLIRNLNSKASGQDRPRAYPIEDDLRKRVEVNPFDGAAYIELGRFYRQLGRYVESEQALTRAAQVNPADYIAYFEAGMTYLDQSKYMQAENMFRKTRELNPQYFMASMQLAFTYKLEGKYKEAERIILEGINADPETNAWGYSELGFCYKSEGRYDEAEEMLKKSTEVLPLYFWAYAELVNCYKIRGKYDQAENILKKAIQVNPEDEKAFAELGRLYKVMGRSKESEEFLDKSEFLASKRYGSKTKYNYHMIKRVLDSKGIRLVCVQYPMRSVKPLQQIFNGEEGIIFVDNQESFREAVQKYGFSQYFDDMFAGDFGHCNAKGNKLLAENIAGAILGQKQR